MEPYRVFLRAQIEIHLALTGSPRAKTLLADYHLALEKFWLVKPKRVSIAALVDDIPGSKREAMPA
jgi:glutamate synthase (NADPH) large chain